MHAMSGMSWARRVSGELFAGSFAGCLSTVVGAPFDIIKVRLQVGDGSVVHPMQCLRGMLGKEGPMSLFRGLTPPLG